MHVLLSPTWPAVPGLEALRCQYTENVPYKGASNRCLARSCSLVHLEAPVFATVVRLQIEFTSLISKPRLLMQPSLGFLARRRQAPNLRRESQPWKTSHTAAGHRPAFWGRTMPTAPTAAPRSQPSTLTQPDALTLRNTPAQHQTLGFRAPPRLVPQWLSCRLRKPLQRHVPGPHRTDPISVPPIMSPWHSHPLSSMHSHLHSHPRSLEYSLPLCGPGHSCLRSPLHRALLSSLRLEGNMSLQNRHFGRQVLCWSRPPRSQP